MMNDVYSKIRFHSALEKIQGLLQKRLLELYQCLRKEYERQKTPCSSVSIVNIEQVNAG